ncbi:FMN-binding negative transcriptional regulator [Silvanigrella aquatica]|uniref:Transcriptional regulator n=1 Tax=Silvanigrella aquatica TaxID=1915309 RepID=A0A1L4CXX3_9BACT|nr:FMN-binding negative transcriptional regulator [Silvanigrella aquatica]APJ02795.1 hypothetical protein AXG55_02185 [Silvanigrella aquatica]
MFIPHEFENKNDELNKILIQNNPLALLIYNNECLEVTNIPISFFGDKLVGHLSIRNEVCKMAKTGDISHLIFNSHSSYISPSWYRNPSMNVPTWNYCTIKLTAKINKITDKQNIKTILEHQIRDFERSQWTMNDFPASLLDDMISEINAFEFKIKSIESKFKISQNRSKEDQISVIKNLQKSKDDTLFIHNIMKQYYEINE